MARPRSRELAHQRGLTNAKSMIQNAAVCERATDPNYNLACQRACNLNHSNSCSNWARNVERSDASQAQKLYARACKGGSGTGCESQARLLTESGGPVDEIEVLRRLARDYHREPRPGWMNRQLVAAMPLYPTRKFGASARTH